MEVVEPLGVVDVGQPLAVVDHRKAGRWRQIKNLVETQLSQTISNSLSIEQTVEHKAAESELVAFTDIVI